MSNIAATVYSDQFTTAPHEQQTDTYGGPDRAWLHGQGAFEPPGGKRRAFSICRRTFALRQFAVVIASRPGRQRENWDGRRGRRIRQRAVEDPAIDIIDICTPNDTHAAIAIGAAWAGKAILCEKPLGLNLAAAEAMARAVKKARVVNMVCHNYRRIPAVMLAKHMIERGDLGDRLFHFRARYAQDWIVDPKFPLVWRLQRDVSGQAHWVIFFHM